MHTDRTTHGKGFDQSDARDHWAASHHFVRGVGKQSVDRSQQQPIQQEFRKTRTSLPRAVKAPYRARPRPRPTPKPAFRRPLDILSKDLAEGTKEAQLWTHNQVASPLLRLPAELRMRIYDFLYPKGGTILIEELKDHAGKSLGFGCRICEASTDPWRARGKREDKMNPNSDSLTPFTTSMTLLNGVCRQLYRETALLPYARNSWGPGDGEIALWNSHTSFSSYVVVQKRLPLPHRKAIRILVDSGRCETNQTTLQALPGLLRIYRHGWSVSMRNHGLLTSAVKRRKNGKRYTVFTKFPVSIEDFYQIWRA
ncbi:hypothetical protein BDV96DRAFT_604417 [Lophiotrema nucula]|uniref:Uncharacterized protein n=1 Tax=Lophiotrema nucula TaxID=690887 RepID=A0A6A5YTT9_9PLEO|nr:hypothetical protein BDV96DRAFT_604417 [Lophiotrema nucula]